MSNAFEVAYVLPNYQDNYPMLSSLDPVSVVRAVGSELRKTLGLIVLNGQDNNDYAQFGKEISSVVAIEYANLDSDYVLSPSDGLMILEESKKMALELLDHVRTVNEWVRYDFTVMTASYLRSNPYDVGLVVRFTERADGSIFGDVPPIQVSDFLVSSVRTIIGR